jgi:hypothetical protein
VISVSSAQQVSFLVSRDTMGSVLRGASLENAFQRVQGRTPHSHHVADRFGEGDVIGNTEARYEVRVSLTGYESMVCSGRELIPKLPEKGLFIAIVKSYRVCEAADRGAGQVS